VYHQNPPQGFGQLGGSTRMSQSPDLASFWVSGSIHQMDRACADERSFLLTTPQITFGLKPPCCNSPVLLDRPKCWAGGDTGSSQPDCLLPLSLTLALIRAARVRPCERGRRLAFQIGQFRRTLQPFVPGAARENQNERTLKGWELQEQLLCLPTNRNYDADKRLDVKPGGVHVWALALRRRSRALEGREFVPNRPSVVGLQSAF
jgi:hypothetical protein